RDFQIVSPFTHVGGNQRQPANGNFGRRPSLVETNDNRLTASVCVKVPHGVAKVAVYPQPSEDAFEVAVAVDNYRPIGGTAQGFANKRCDRSSDSHDRANATGNLLN